MAGATPLRIVGRYELHGELASGGMATVHLGRSIGAAGFTKSVAIKRLHPHYARDPDFVTQLLEEARLSERIRHPNVVAMLDVVAAEDELLLVMEYVHGETLARLLRTCVQDGVRCPPEIASSIAHGVLLGLHAAHTATDADGAPLGIVHRDVSPQNIIVGADGIARLLDFGIAKAAGAASHTREGEVKGKVPYMAPEILGMAPASQQSDVYAVAVTLWESLCARRLFRADTEVGVWAEVLKAVVPQPSTLVGDIGAVEDVVMRGLDRDTAARYPTAIAMANALEASIRLASAAEVAAWVAERAAASLAERSSSVRAIERTPLAATAPARAANTTQPAPVVAARSAPPPPLLDRPRRRLAWPLAVLALASMLAAGLLAVRSVAARQARAAPPLADTSAAAATDLPPSLQLPSAPATGVSTAPSAEARPVEPAGVRPRRPASPTSAPGVAPSAARSTPDPCDPPYLIDAAGRKHFKLNCVN